MLNQSQKSYRDSWEPYESSGLYSDRSTVRVLTVAWVNCSYVRHTLQVWLSAFDLQNISPRLHDRGTSFL